MANNTLTKVDWLAHRVRLKPIIDKIAASGEDPNYYKELDQACSSEWAFLFLAPDGFVILRPRHQNNLTYLELLLVHATGNDSLKRYTPALCALGRCINADYLEFLTFRKGFNRVAHFAGWEHSGYYNQSVIWRYPLRKHECRVDPEK